MPTPQVLILGKDIYTDYVENLQNITKEKTFDKMRLITNQYTLPVLNRDNQFSINNPVSMFHGIRWLYTPVDIINKDEEYDFRGSLIGIPRLNGKANLVLKDTFYKFRNNIIEYESSTWETGAEAFKNICDNIGYEDYSQSSYQKSYNILNTAGCKIKCNFNLSSGVTFQNAINKIALFSNAFVYMDNNEMHFKTFEYITSGISFTIKDSDLKGTPKIDEDESSMYNDYSISYYGDLGIPATDILNNNIGEVSRNINETKTIVMRGDNRSQIIFENLTSAVFIGEGKIKRTHKTLLTNPQPLSFMNFNLYKDFERQLTLNTNFYMNYNIEDWDNNIMEPFSYTVSQVTNDISVLAYEVAS